jgi:hypothetical protein
MKRQGQKALFAAERNSIRDIQKRAREFNAVFDNPDISILFDDKYPARVGRRRSKKYGIGKSERDPMGRQRRRPEDRGNPGRCDHQNHEYCFNHLNSV